MSNRTTVEKSDLEMVVTRTINGPARLVWEAWTKPELFRRWWVPKSMGLNLLTCEVDVRVGGTYRLEFATGGAAPLAFVGRYVEVTPHSRIVWTNEEAGGLNQVTTVIFEDLGQKTLIVFRERYPTKEAFDAASGMEATTHETLDQLEQFVMSR